MGNISETKRHRQDLFELVLEKLNEFSPGEVTNIVWAMACLGQGSLHVQFGKLSGFYVVEYLLTRSIRIIDAFPPISISMMAHSLAKLNFMGAKEFMPLLAVSALPKLNAFTPQDMSVFVYSLGRLGYQDHVKFLPPLLKQLEITIEEITLAQQVSNIFMGLSKLKISAERVLSLQEKAQKWSLSNLDKFSTEEISEYVSAMNQLRFLPSEAFLSKVDAYCRRNLNDFAPHEAAKILVACANAHHICQPLVEGLHSIQDFDFEDRDSAVTSSVLILWSCALLDILTPERMRWVSKALNAFPLYTFSIPLKIQLAQSMISFKMRFPEMDMGKILSPELIQVNINSLSKLCERVKLELPG